MTFSKFFIRFSVSLLLAALLFGVLASVAFLYPELFNSWLPFHKLRPMHTSAALFWIISAAAGCICFFKYQLGQLSPFKGRMVSAFIFIWMLTIAGAFIAYFFNAYGGREYWEFPSWLNIPLWAGWALFTYVIWSDFKINSPAYEWMWLTGAIFFLITFTEQNLWHLDWFRNSYIREVTVQWKANGSMVGAWNQMINGLSVFLIIRISGNKDLGSARKTYFLFFLGLFNMMFNWGHHVYNVPNNNWMRGVAYAVSMTEWVILISIIRNFRKFLKEGRKLAHSLSYAFIASAEIWLFANLFLALLMSVPAINRYTHGTHITVAHAMGTTIGINTMILLAVVGEILQIDKLTKKLKRVIGYCIRLNNIALGIFWMSLIIAGLIKGYTLSADPNIGFSLLMEQVKPYIMFFTVSGVFVVFSLGIIAVIFLRRPAGKDVRNEPGSVEAESIREYDYQE